MRRLSVAVAAATVALAALPLGAAQAAAAPPSYSVGAVTLDVGTAPFSLSLRRDGEILGRAVSGATADRGALHYKLGGTWFGSTGLRSVQTVGDTLLVTATTAGQDVALALTPGQGGRLAAQVRGPVGSTDTGLTLSIADAGHWYGGGETKTQPWPMDAGDSLDFTAPWPNDATFWYADKGKNRPYATSDNGWDVQTPFWYTSSGLGLFMNTYDYVDMAFNAKSDGLFVLGDPHRAVLDATLYAEPDARAVYDAFLADRGPRSPLPTAALSMLAKPIWTTWSEFKQVITADIVLQFASDIVSHDLPHGIMEIDDQWNTTQVGWGDMEFDKTRFPDPKGMVDALHAKGFQVTLWIPPFIQFGNPTGVEAVQNGYCVKTPQGTPYAVKWWNNATTGSCLLDYSNPAAGQWWAAKLSSLQSRYGIDGFKFDGGEANFMPQDAVTYGHITSNQYADVNMRWAAQHGFDIHEMRSSWLGQPQGRIVREFDKDTQWGLDNGLHSVITQALALSAIGFPYSMPDMIGGNQYGAALNDPELMARWTELSSFMEMMQFSIRPWNTLQHPALDATTTAIAQRYSNLFMALLPYRKVLVDRAQQTGAPVLEPLFFESPRDPVAQTVDDEWLLGPDLLAAPVVKQGQTSRDVYLPAGRWRSLYGDGGVVTGPVMLHDVPAPLAAAPAYYRVDGQYSGLIAGIASTLGPAAAPTPDLPESPYAVGLPLAALCVGGGWILVRRRRVVA